MMSSENIMFHFCAFIVQVLGCCAGMAMDKKTLIIWSLCFAVYEFIMVIIYIYKEN